MKPIQLSGLFALACTAFFLNSCATGGRSPSGFLSNFSQLDAGYGTTDAVAAYVKPGVDLKQYDSVLIEPVTTVVATTSISTEVTDQLAAYLGAALHTQAAAGRMKIAKVPGPGTLRVRTALTDVIPGVEKGKPVTTVHTAPQAPLTGPLGSGAVASFVDSLSFEGELVDSVTGERICALCDHRLGAKREFTAETTWATIRNATNQGAARLYQRFLAAKSQ